MALDAEVRAYAVAEHRILVTHDRGLALRSRSAQEPHLWLRCREPEDRELVAVHLAAIAASGSQGRLSAIIQRDGTLQLHEPGSS